MKNEVLKFEKMGLSENIIRALSDIGYEEATAIQSQTIPEILKGKDIIGQSQTGTGKTAAYSLPIIENIDREEKTTQAIILCPTRELAVQITSEIRKFTKYEEGIKCLSVYGGESILSQIQSLRKGVQIVIGTPGRIMDHMRRKTLKLDGVKIAVLDEADEMLNMGFEEDMNTILSQAPENRQTVLFSATMNKKILNISKKYLKEPLNVKIQSKELTVDKIEQTYIEVKSTMKDEAIMRLIDFNNPKKAVVFCNTKKKVDSLLELLKKNNYKAECLHGDVKQEQRQRIMNRLKNGEFKILVATDVVARGIDIDELELVINYDIPQEEEYYVHRIGRTGRNGSSGKAYTLVVGREKGKILDIQKYANTKILVGKIPTIEEISKIKNKHVVEKVQNIIDKNSFNNEEDNNDILKDLLNTNESEMIIKALLEMINPKKKEIVKVNNTESDRNNKRDNTKEKSKQENRRKRENISNGFSSNIPDGEAIKFFINIGKKDKISAKDIIGSITANSPISGENIGKIKILDNFSFVEVKNECAKNVLTEMQGKQIKGKDFNIEIAKA